MVVVTIEWIERELQKLLHLNTLGLRCHKADIGGALEWLPAVGRIESGNLYVPPAQGE